MIDYTLIMTTIFLPMAFWYLNGVGWEEEE